MDRSAATLALPGAIKVGHRKRGGMVVANTIQTSRQCLILVFAQRRRQPTAAVRRSFKAFSSTDPGRFRTLSLVVEMKKFGLLSLVAFSWSALCRFCWSCFDISCHALDCGWIAPSLACTRQISWVGAVVTAEPKSLLALLFGSHKEQQVSDSTGSYVFVTLIRASRVQRCSLMEAADAITCCT